MHKAGYLTHQRMKEPGSLYATHFIRFLIHCTLFILGKDEGKVITMAGKHKDPKKFQNPAPGQYEKEKADKVIYGSQQYSFGLRPEEKIKARAPAPNAYDPEKADTIIVITIFWSVLVGCRCIKLFQIFGLQSKGVSWICI